jgi:hypothetical protein
MNDEERQQIARWWLEPLINGPGDAKELSQADLVEKYENRYNMPRDNQGETAASIRMRMRRDWTAVVRA